MAVLRYDEKSKWMLYAKVSLNMYNPEDKKCNLHNTWALLPIRHRRNRIAKDLHFPFL